MFNVNTWRHLYVVQYCSVRRVESVVCNHQLGMDGYMFSELADMVMCYGEARGSGRGALRIYQERFPNRQHPHHTIFSRLYQRLRDTGSLRARRIGGRPRATRTPEFEEEVLRRVDNDPATSTRVIANAMGTNQSSVLRVLQEQNLHAYHLQKVHGLGPNDFAPRVQFVQWFLQRSIVNPPFPAHVLFTDEACFTRDTYFNSRNSHIWDYENPHAVFFRSHQERFTVNIWGGIVGDYLLGPIILPAPLNGAAYLAFLENTLPLLMEEIPLAIRREMWFQHDGAPPHFSLAVREHLNQSYREHWIGRGGPVAWPARSPDLTPLDFFLWGHVKSVVYITPVNTRDELIERIFSAFDEIKHRPDTFARVRQSMVRRCQECNEVQGTHFEHRL